VRFSADHYLLVSERVTTEMEPSFTAKRVWNLLFHLVTDS